MARRSGGQQLTPTVREALVKDGVVHGFTAAIGTGSVIMLVAAVVAGAMVTTPGTASALPEKPAPEPPTRPVRY
ncbi:hypothetical protein [Streptomyces sp. BP-8]|uniref:hypothetical protein n=1 Tax=Streptomyces sirii TaxID=3127701 RepID=UPI0038909C47